jgi:hypothetical protein
MSQPADLAAVQWHAFAESKRYASREKARRACDWLNANQHRDADWRFRPGAQQLDGRVVLERRYVGHATAWWPTTAEGQTA